MCGIHLVGGTFKDVLLARKRSSERIAMELMRRIVTAERRAETVSWGVTVRGRETEVNAHRRQVFRGRKTTFG
jgi:hypothetical protein